MCTRWTRRSSKWPNADSPRSSRPHRQDDASVPSVTHAHQQWAEDQDPYKANERQQDCRCDPQDECHYRVPPAADRQLLKLLNVDPTDDQATLPAEGFAGPATPAVDDCPRTQPTS